MMIRKATLGDMKTIHALIAEQARAGHVIARAMSDLYSQVRDFTVWQEDDTGELLGCGALHICWEDLAEIRSLAVGTARQGRGIGTELIKYLLEEARQMNVRRVFVLTYRLSLFEKNGFEQIEKSQLPHKIWADCLKCNKFPDCDEIALATSP
jgi:amino-acid N-acetyltransferase